MRRIAFLIFLCFSITAFAQMANPKDHFSYEKFKVSGDLNKDGLADLVIVSQDTNDNKWPYRLQVFFAQPGGKNKLVVSTEKAIEAAFPDGKDGWRSGNDFSDASISNGVLSINVELLRGHYEHKFRYQNGNFELIGYSQVYSDGIGTMTDIDFNLSTGVRIEIKENYETDKVISKKKKKIMIRPLPKLQDFVPNEQELY